MLGKLDEIRAEHLSDFLLGSSQENLSNYLSDYLRENRSNISGPCVHVKHNRSLRYSITTNAFVCRSDANDETTYHHKEIFEVVKLFIRN